VVDLPDLVGHPAFPDTMERLVTRNGGTVLDAARAALERGEAEACVVDGARLLAPILPAALRSADASESSHPVIGPSEEIPWPAGAGWLELRPRVAAILRRPIGAPLAPSETPEAIFGYTLVADWRARDASGDPMPRPDGVPIAIGPCVVTADGIDPQTTFVAVRVDGREWGKGNLNGAARELLTEVAAASRTERLRAGEAFAAAPFELDAFDQRVWPGALVEIEAEGIGVLSNRLGRPT